MKPELRSKVLAKDGVDPPSSIATRDTNVLDSGGRTTQSSEKSSSSMKGERPLQSGGYGKNLTHVEQPLVQVVTQENFLVSRSCMTPRNGKGSGDPVNLDQLPPQTCPPSLPPLLNGYGGCKLPRGQEGGHGSLPPDKLKVKCQAGGQVDVKKIEQKGVSNRTPYLLSKDGTGGMSPTTNNRQIDVPKKPQQTQATHACSKHDSVAKDGMGGHVINHKQ
ncbi:unnamed protein product [Linum trigynum]|uniref:Uncharacterized protein n=1 Tax=Linum trigynum TaxID=586398 RepID=A0AAV2EQA8_9ROSI